MHPVILLSCIQNERDPICSGNGRFFNALAGALAKDFGSRCIMSMPTHSNLDIVRKLDLSNWDIQLSSHVLPQQRLNELFEIHGFDHALILSSYSLFVDFQNIERCLSCSEEYDFIDFSPWSPPNFFCRMGKKFAGQLATITKYPVTTFQFSYFGKRFPGDATVRVVENRSPTARVVNMIFGHLERADIGFPEDEFVADYFDSCAEMGISPFAERSFLQHLSSNRKVDGTVLDFATINAAINRIYPESDQMDKITSSMRLIFKNSRSWMNNRGVFLELGFGRAPTVSMFLAHFFDRGYAVEPYAYKSEHIEDARHISEAFVKLQQALPNPKHNLPIPNDGPPRLEIISRELRTEDIPDGSVDFCFSVTVLEHIDAFEDTFALLHRKMRKGGTMLHLVDFKDHGQKIPFRFYAHSISEWRDKKMGTNLLRINDMKTIFEHIGFEAAISQRVFIDDLPGDMNQFWKNYTHEDLTTASCVFLLWRIPNTL